MKTLVFDMDGTIADLYGVRNWLELLRAEDESPYIMAEPLYDMEHLKLVLDMLKTAGWTIAVTTWLAKESSKDFDERVSTAKKYWLNKMNFPYDEIHIIKYGESKADCTRWRGGRQILIDDDEKVRKSWDLGDTIDAGEDILQKLIDLLILEVA